MSKARYAQWLSRAAFLRSDRGSVTIEAALGLSSLVIVAAAVIGGIATMAAYLSAIDAAGAAARSHAIGVDFQPPNSDMSVRINESSGLVTASVEVPAPIGSMSATAIFPQEMP